MPLRDASIVFDRVADRYDQTRGGQRRGRVLGAAVAPWLVPGARTLEIGVGTGLVAAALRADGRPVVGVDLSPGMLAHARARVGPVVARADAHVLPVADSALDNVYIVWVLHVVADPATVVRECARVLRVGGRVVVCTGRPRVDASDIATADAGLSKLRPIGDDRDSVVGYAEAAGLALVEAMEIANEYDLAPATHARHIEERVYAFLWDVDDDTWRRVVQPVVDGLRRLPEPDVARRLMQRQDLLAFERPA
jgi:SAM-dependent methyltransferase